jgi:hypothetical protein
LQFSGVITEDSDHDGIVEAWAAYRNGMIQEYSHDSQQNGTADLIITFAQGLPARAAIALASDDFGPVFPLNHEGRRQVLLRWEQYPAVLDAEVDGKRYIFRPFDYYFTPVRFITLVLGGPDYPEWEEPPILTERSLLSFSVVLEQPSVEFPGGTERIELSGGLPVKSIVYLNGRIVSETEFRLGQPMVQYLDLDLDGRMETVRRFDPDIPYRIRLTERDLDGDGIYEYAEE